MAARWQRERIEIPKGYTPEERQVIAQEILDFIVDRTQKKSKDKNNIKFPKYSKEYKASQDFKVAGKSSKVNLTLSGDMLASMELLSHSPDSLLIGFEKGTDENGKADGNIRGTYGTNKARPSKARDFLGITDADLNKILKRFPLEDIDKRKEEIEKSKAIFEAAEMISKKTKLTLSEIKEKAEKAKEALERIEALREAETGVINGQ